jgi:hypothetical protein
MCTTLINIQTQNVVTSKLFILLYCSPFRREVYSCFWKVLSEGEEKQSKNLESILAFRKYSV